MNARVIITLIYNQKKMKPEKYEHEVDEVLYKLSECIELRLFPMSYRSLFELVKRGEKKKLGEDIDDYIFAVDLGTDKKSMWFIAEREIATWIRRRKKMGAIKGLKRPRPPKGLIMQ